MYPNPQYPCLSPPTGAEGTLSGDPATAPDWLMQPSGLGTSEVPAAQLQDTAIPSQSEGSEETSPDLVLPVSGLPPIPPHLVKAIKQGKYVDLPDLLPEALREAQFNKACETKEETKLKRRFSITTTLDWMAAFSAYTAVAVHLKPQRAFELAAYTSIIISLTRDGRGQAWSRYDQQFRQAAAVNPGLQWHKREPDIWLMAFMGAAAPPATRPPSQQGQPAAQRSTSICRNWNRGTCTYPQCKYRHVCFVCSDAGHVTRDCPTIATASMPGNVRQAPK